MCTVVRLVAVVAVVANASEAPVNEWAPAWAAGRRWAVMALSEPGTSAQGYRAQKPAEASIEMRLGAVPALSDQRVGRGRGSRGGRV
ncbi:MAG: hypothetical protein K6U14_05670 [Firmicutes bacterium]|nr:hypothetical protein [Alicyclobacillaceae bacterium]MCL6497107.1 hypothetical protein [Bacillota bacterium]